MEDQESNQMDDNMEAENLEADEENDETQEGELMGIVRLDDDDAFKFPHDTWKQETWRTHLPMRM